MYPLLPPPRVLQHLLLREGVDSVPILIQGETREDFTATEKISGHEFRFVLPGPALRPDECQSLLATLDGIEPCPTFGVISGSLPPGVPADLYAQVVRLMKKKGAKIIVDTSGPALGNALTEGVYLVKPNLREFRELMQAPLSGEHELIRASKSVINRGQAHMVALTLGEDGALLVTKEQVWRGHAPKVAAVSSVGAGDSFLAGMISGLVRQRPITDYLRYAIAAGTAALLSPGTDLCWPADVERLLPHVTVQEFVPAS